MRTFVTLAAASLSVLGAAGQQVPAGPATKPNVEQLLMIAKCAGPMEQRLTAIDALGQVGSLGAKDPAVVGAVVTGLKCLLELPAGPERNLLVMYAARALGRLGPAAGEAVPDLVKAKGADATVDATVDAALSAILAPPKEATAPAKPKTSLDLQQTLADAFQALQGDDRGVSHLIDVVQNQRMDPGLRMAAAAALGRRKAEAKPALDALAGVVGERGVDPDLKAIAEVARQRIRDAAAGQD